MLGISAWCAQLARTLIACSLAVLVFAPSLDAVLCGTEGVPAANAQRDTGVGPAAHDVASAQIDPGDSHHGLGAGDAPCMHGHCHHGLQYFVSAVDATPVLMAARPVHSLPPTVSSDSMEPTGLERPPRA